MVKQKMFKRIHDFKKRGFLQAEIAEKNRLIIKLILFCRSVSIGRRIKPKGIEEYSSDYYFPENRELWLKKAEYFCKKYLKTDIEDEMRKELLEIKNEYIPESRQQGNMYYQWMLNDKKSKESKKNKER